MNNSYEFEPELISRIRALNHFKSSPYHDLDIPGTLDFFYGRYILPLKKVCDINTSLVVDCGAGYGWFSIAYILAGGKAAIAVDVDSDRLSAANKIAELISVEKQIEFICSPIHQLPLSIDSADLFVSIETLEHVGRENIRPSLQKIKETTSKAIIITSPNKFFPVIAHDTRLPFAHWVSANIRKQYAQMFGREGMNDNNQFLSPFDLNILMDKFKPVSSCLTFLSFKEYMGQYPYYLPYGATEMSRMQYKPSLLKSNFYKIVSAILGNYSYWVMPNLAHLFLRR